MNSPHERLLLTRARLPETDGSASSLMDIAIVDGTVTAIERHGRFSVPDVADYQHDDLDGALVIAGLVEPHAHLDKALTADVVPNPAGDLMGAIEAWVAAEERGVFDLETMTERAVAALARLVANGVTAVRTHVNVGASDPNFMHLRAVRAARQHLGTALEIQIVALMHSPMAGVAGAANRQALEGALEIGVDLIGGCPHLEDDGPGMIAAVCEMARTAGVGLDLHVDETLDPAMLTLRDLCRYVEETDFSLPVAASHCVSLSVQPAHVQEEISVLAARSKVAIIALPQTNLFLQGRDHPQSMPRGITPVDSLRRQGVRVAAGGDNVQDPFNPVGRSDPLETAALMIMAAHQLPRPAFDLVSNDARAVLGLPPAGPRVGAVADLVALPAESLRQAMADAPSARRTYRRGRLTAVTEITRSFVGFSSESTGTVGR